MWFLNERTWSKEFAFLLLSLPPPPAHLICDVSEKALRQGPRCLFPGSLMLCRQHWLRSLNLQVGLFEVEGAPSAPGLLPGRTGLKSLEWLCDPCYPLLSNYDTSMVLNGCDLADTIRSRQATKARWSKEVRHVQGSICSLRQHSVIQRYFMHCIPCPGI